MSDRRRINVAITRARRQVVVVGDVETCSSDSFLKGLLDYISENGDHRSAAEFLESVDQSGSLGMESLVAVTDCFPAKQTIVKKSPDKERAPTYSKKKLAQATVPLLTIPRSEYEAKLNDALASLVIQFAEKNLQGGAVTILPYDATVHRSSKLVVVESNDSSQDTLVFPSTLNSFQRMKLHATAEEKSLSHRTIESSEGKMLYISLNKSNEEEHPSISDDFVKISKKEINTKKEPPQYGNKKSATLLVGTSGESKGKRVDNHGSVYISPFRLAQQQNAIDFSIDDEDALLDQAIHANKVIYLPLNRKSVDRLL